MKIKTVPVPFFGIVLGLVGLGNSWRLASKAWLLPKEIGESILAIGAITWIILVCSYISKLLWARKDALLELKHPLQSCFVGLIGVSTLLIAIAVNPYQHSIAFALFIIGSIMQLSYGVYFTSRLWKGENDPNQITPAYYLPSTAGNFVSSFAAGIMGHHTLGFLFIGAGFFFWISLESIISNRLKHRATMPEPLRPMFGIMLAPPAVGCAAYLANTSGTPDIFAQALLGYATIQFLILLRLLPWIFKQPFAASYWAFSFGLTALTSDSINFVLRGMSIHFEWPAIALFSFSNCVLLFLFLKTILLLAAGKLLPKAALPLNN